MKHKIGNKIDFYLFGVLDKGVIYEINKEEETVSVHCGGYYEGEWGVGKFLPYKYPSIQTFDKLPKNKKEIPPWYILNGKPVVNKGRKKS